MVRAAQLPFPKTFRSNPRLRLITLFFSLIVSTITPCLSHGSDDNLEKDLQLSLEQSKTVLADIHRTLQNGKTAKTEIDRLKSIVENIKVTNLLLEERFRLREEKVKAQGPKAKERHQAMKEGYEAAVKEYLALADSLITGSQTSTISDQQTTIIKLKKILDKVLPKKKKPIIGSLPYKHLNYPAKEPAVSPEIIPAYKGGNKTVSAADTQTTEEAPISKEIATLAQSLNWNPVSIYEYVKNNVETEWYWGCMKGAEETLRQKSGNDCDQATLLAALLRASRFPTRYVRGAIEFFPDIDKVKNLTGLSDPWQIAEFFQKAGIPYKPIIAGGRIANFQIEHIWVESQIPYANYRGAIIDEHGKTWLGLDTSIKVKDYVYNNAKDIIQEPGFSRRLAEIREEYLGASMTQTPLEYLQSRINSELQALNSQQTYSDFLQARTLPQEHMNILPAGMQFKEIAITNEYTAIPDDLKHKVRFIARNSQNSELLNTELALMKLSNQQVSISYEPETVEDQEIINSYGGLDNTPAYLVRLRPMLKINGERIIVGQDGLPMGSEYDLKIDLLSPNGIETITNAMITGNLSVIGIVSQRTTTTPSPEEGNKNAEQLLFETAQHYINRWNKPEDEMGSLLHLSVARPLPTVVTLGGIIDVTYLLDVPHGFIWKGVYVDADLRAIEAAHRTLAPDNRTQLFMQMSSLQGSILENRIFEDDFKVETISTAKLFQLVNSDPSRPQLITIDKYNIGAILPALAVDDNIKEDITNSVNQNYTIRIPGSEISYHDWTGVGYIKENAETGESGWMLSGMIAGGMTALEKEQWINQDIATVLNLPNTLPPNPDPNAVVRLVRMSDYPVGSAGTILSVPCQVRAEDIAGKPVQNVHVTFRITAGGGKIQGVDKAGNTLPDLKTNSSLPVAEYTIKTGLDGIARVKLTLGEKIDTSPLYRQELSTNNKQYWELVGLNMISMTAPGSESTIYTDKPFEAYARAGVASKIEIVSPNTTVYGIPNTLASSAWVKVVDQYGNSISGKNVKFYVVRTFKGDDPGPEAKTARLYSNVTDCPGTATLDCAKAKEYTLDQPLAQFAEHFGAMAYVIMGNTANTRFTVKALAMNDNFNSEGKRVDSDVPLTTADMVYETSAKADNKAEFALAALGLYQFDEAGNKTDAGLAGQAFSEKLKVELFYHKEGYESATDTSGNYYLKGTGIFTVEKIISGQVTYEPITAGGIVSSPVATADSNGFYTTNLTLGQDPGLNTIKATGSAQLKVPKIDSTSGVISSPTTTLTAKTAFNIWGIKPSVAPDQLVQVNEEGYPVADTEIHYSILPADYKYSTKSLHLDFYEKDTLNNEAWMGFLQADPTGKIIISQGGIKFNPSYTYSVQLVVDRGTKKEVVSTKVSINVAAFYIEKIDPEFPNVKLRWDDYYPALGSKTITIKSSSLNGSIVECAVIEPTDETMETIELKTKPMCNSVSNQIVNNTVAFTLSGEGLGLMVKDDPTTGINEIKLRFSVKKNNTIPFIEAIYHIKNNSMVTLSEVLEGKAVFTAGQETVASTLIGATPDQQGLVYVQELLNQAMPRMREFRDKNDYAIPNNYKPVAEDGMFSQTTSLAIEQFKRNFLLTGKNSDGERTGNYTSMFSVDQAGSVKYDEKADDTTDLFRKLMKDYNYRTSPEQSSSWLHKIVDKAFLVGAKERIPGDGEQMTVDNADASVNGTAANSRNDTGVYELYKNVVTKYIDRMIKEAERYAGLLSDTTLGENPTDQWKGRYGEGSAAHGKAVSYSYGGKMSVEQFNAQVSSTCYPEKADKNGKMQYVESQLYGVFVNDKGEKVKVPLAASAIPTPENYLSHPTIVPETYNGNLDEDCSTETGSQKYAGLKKNEFESSKQHDLIGYSASDKDDASISYFLNYYLFLPPRGSFVFPQYEAKKWAGIDCSGFMQRSLNSADALNIAGAKSKVDNLGDGTCNVATQTCLSCEEVGSQGYVPNYAFKLYESNLAIKGKKEALSKVRKGDLVVYKGHVALVYSDKLSCGEITKEKQGKEQIICEYQIIHASGNDELCYKAVDSRTKDCDFNRKVVLNTISDELQSKTLKSPSGFGRIKIWD